jgi:hypothetical protein
MHCVEVTILERGKDTPCRIRENVEAVFGLGDGNAYSTLRRAKIIC